MTENNISIETGNRLIAEFDGAVMQVIDLKMSSIGQTLCPTGKMYFENIQRRFPDNMYTCKIADLKYHSSWDWLMPVVEKINSIKGFDVIIYKTTVHINDEREILIETSGEIKSAIWEAVVQFIQWYNQNK